MCTEKKPHVHAALIKAWADGAVIQIRRGKILIWEDNPHPCWSPKLTYRIKPEPKPDVVSNCFVGFEEAWKRPRIYYNWSNDAIPAEYKHNQGRKDLAELRFVFDGETGVLKSAEIIK
jgi:hypothetical protein